MLWEVGARYMVAYARVVFLHHWEPMVRETLAAYQSAAPDILMCEADFLDAN